MKILRERDILDLPRGTLYTNKSFVVVIPVREELALEAAAFLIERGVEMDFNSQALAIVYAGALGWPGAQDLGAK